MTCKDKDKICAECDEIADELYHCFACDDWVCKKCIDTKASEKTLARGDGDICKLCVMEYQLEQAYGER